MKLGCCVDSRHGRSCLKLTYESALTFSNLIHELYGYIYIRYTGYEHITNFLN